MVRVFLAIAVGCDPGRHRESADREVVDTVDESLH
jgi:hypothetical protein